MLSNDHSIIIYPLCDADWVIICPNQACIEEVMHVGIMVVLDGIPKSLLSEGVVPKQRPTKSDIFPSSHLWLSFFSIFEFQHHNLSIMHVFIIVDFNICGWKTFSMPKALTHISISLAFSPMVIILNCDNLWT